MKESVFQSNLIKKLRFLFPGCYILKTDPNYIQGFPDLLILVGHKWAALECKSASSSSRRPNQDYYVQELNNLSFASFIFPENEEEVLHELQQALRP